MKNLFKIVVLSMIFTMMFGVSVFAGNGRCGYKGCERSTANCHNGTVFCDTHAAAYAREHGYKSCAASGCYDYAKSGSSYCSSHTCSHSKCTNKVTERRGYCTTHKCKYSGCSNCAYYTSGANKGYCSSHASKSSYSTKSSTKKSNSSKKKSYEMPDCDDYEDWDDFMDDWDGCMPDGSDASDYWDNW